MQQSFETKNDYTKKGNLWNDTLCYTFHKMNQLLLSSIVIRLMLYFDVATIYDRQTNLSIETWPWIPSQSSQPKQEHCQVPNKCANYKENHTNICQIRHFTIFLESYSPVLHNASYEMWMVILQ